MTLASTSCADNNTDARTFRSSILISHSLTVCARCQSHFRQKNASTVGFDDQPVQLIASRITYVSRASDKWGLGCSRMGALPVMHVNTTLFILISALFADARFSKASSARTKKHARECAARCASKFMRGGGFGGGRMRKHLHPRRMMPKKAS
jgi:hypothetical protein